MLDISYQLLPESERRKEPFVPAEKLPFGKLHSEHVFMMEYKDGAWQNPRIVPYKIGLHLSFGASCIPYGATIFEGGKAFQHEDGEIYTFRFDENAKRLNNSGEILVIPGIPVENQIQATEALIDVDRLWYPQQEGAYIYIRPEIFEIDDKTKLGVGKEYIFLVMLRPSGAYYSQGFNSGKLLITDRYHRAAPGGTGQAKCGGNYGASRRAEVFANRFGCQQVLFLDVFNQEIEEAGAMNHYHVTKDGKVVIPEFTDTILKSITSRSILDLSPRLGFPVVQERIPIDEFIEQLKPDVKGIIEAGGFGTAASVAPTGEYLVDLKSRKKVKDLAREDLGSLVVNDGKVGDYSRAMFETVTGIQWGRLEDTFGWMKKVERRV